jgi:transcriptional repressor NrdR
MRCPYCNEDRDRVVDSRTSQEGRSIRRRRECLGCGQRFTTYEYVEERPLQVIKRAGGVEPFDRGKLLRSLQLPCAKRPITPADIEAMVDDVAEALAQQGRDEVDSRRIGELVMERLKASDHVAYVRFASVYRNFKDIDEFVDELRELRARQARAALGENQVELPL